MDVIFQPWDRCAHARQTATRNWGSVYIGLVVVVVVGGPSAWTFAPSFLPLSILAAILNHMFSHEKTGQILGLPYLLPFWLEWKQNRPTLPCKWESKEGHPPSPPSGSLQDPSPACWEILDAAKLPLLAMGSYLVYCSVGLIIFCCSELSSVYAGVSRKGLCYLFWSVCSWNNCFWHPGCFPCKVT